MAGFRCDSVNPTEARNSELDPNVAVMNATLGAVGSGSQWVMGTQQWEVPIHVSNETT